ncbi:MAG: transcriptional regulator [Myxococcaceae bacterium]|nr:transcriptional regulator [Myxococcaceae bacterium]
MQPRWYDDACGAAHALELVGERWALLVVRELMFGARRFGEIREGLPGISANVLTQRLAGLEAAGIVVRRQLPSPANAHVYELTPWGYESEPIFQTLGRWAARSPSHDASLPLSAVSVLLSFRTMIDPARAKGFEATIGLRLGGDTFVARVHKSEITIRRTALEDVDATLTGEPTALAAVVYGGRALTAAEDAGALTVEGNRALAKRFVTLFRLPAKA